MFRFMFWKYANECIFNYIKPCYLKIKSVLQNHCLNALMNQLVKVVKSSHFYSLIKMFLNAFVELQNEYSHV